MHSITFAVPLFFLLWLCSSTHCMTFNQTLRDGDLLLSDANSYALGFFTPGKSTGKRYLGIWYQNIPELVAVWVANRDNPVNGTSGVLFIDRTGNLVIQDRNTNFTVWNTSLSFPATGLQNPYNYSVQLQETGNLVLYHDPDKRVAAWQSFDYPTNTFMAYMKFGVDKKAGLNRFLTSWKSPDDPGTGEYSARMELNGTPEAFMYKNSSRVWRVGSWNGVGWSNIPEMSRNFTAYNYTENRDEVTQSYTVRDPTVYTILVLNGSGTLNRIIWQGNNDMGQKTKKWVGLWYVPKDNCDAFDQCGAFGICNPYNLDGFDCKCLPGFESNSSTQEWGLKDGRHSCRREANTDTCRNGDGFLKLTNVNIPDSETAFSNRAMGFKECEERCVKNCSCIGYARANISAGGEGCINWYGELRDMREFANGGRDMYIRVSSSALAQSVKKSKALRGKRLIILAMVVPIAGVILLVLCFTRKNRKGSASAMYLEEAAPADVIIFDVNTIKAVTDNFSADNKLGEGGFGSVFKGKLQNGKLVAVKRLKTSSDQGTEELKNEVMLIARLQHRNLVRLLGYCIQQREKMLVYEYMPNNSLDNFIFDNVLESSLSWRTRSEIISGIAQGLLYLHQDSRLKIIHRDLKASNVLLDASMQPKISDFGMARIFGDEQIEANTNQVVGTYGYMSPEYAMEGHFSVKSDVFSFGVLMLEIVSGKKNKYQHTRNSVNLIGDVWSFWNEEKALDIVDPLLGRDNSTNIREMLRCIHVGLLCVQPLPHNRPNVSEVIFMLSNQIELPCPNPPGFMVKQGNMTPSSYLGSGGNESNNSMSFSQMEGR
ncbi:unnamed protein product [Cuscuta epithymum]|uniref:Receptor-like serine/threonine-protein kinase n=1 Tax=Cuscuta epithymum TaxID=186058 RepID=A0AAV0F5R3_9ASTE|nr:unnamed protein product [Cuscuta epithymum]